MCELAPIEVAIEELESRLTLEERIKRALKNKKNWQPNLRILAQIIGDIEALKVAEAFGGVSIYIPILPRETNPLKHLLTSEAYRVLCDSFLNGGYFVCPRGEMSSSPKYLASLLLEMGYAQRQVAIHLQLNQRTVHRLAKKIKENLSSDS